MIIIRILLPLIFCAQFAAALTNSFNFMWAQKEVDNNQQYIFPKIRKKITSDSENWTINVQDWLSVWLRDNPDGHFVFWFNNKTVTPEQIENTKALFEELKEEFLTRGGTIELKAIQDLKIYKENPDIFSPEVPFYLQIDLARLGAGLEYVKQCSDECAFLYADVDKGFKLNKDGILVPLNLKAPALYDTETKGNLLNYGLIYNFNQENNAFIIGNKNEFLLKSIEDIAINSSIIRIRRLLKEIDFIKYLMKNGLATKEDIAAAANEAINLIYFRMSDRIPYYFYHLKNRIKLKDKSDSGKPLYEIFGEMDQNDSPFDFFDISGDVNGKIVWKNPYTGKQTRKKILSDRAFPEKDFGGSRPVSDLNAEEKLFGRDFFKKWLKSYDNREDAQRERAQEVRHFLVDSGKIDPRADIEFIVPDYTNKADSILFINSKKRGSLVALILKNLNDLKQEQALIGNQQTLIDAISRIENNNLKFPTLIKAEALEANNIGLIIMADVKGVRLKKIFNDLVSYSDDNIAKIFTAIGEEMGNLQSLYFLKNKTFIYSSGQNSDNILFNLDEMKSYWINLDLREADISEVGLYSRVDPDNFFNDFLRKSYIIKFTNMPWDEGLRKYFLALASLIRSYENAFKNNLSPDLYKNIFEKPNRLMKEKLEQIIALAARRHAQWISENSLIKEEEETRRKIHDLLIEENLLIF